MIQVRTAETLAALGPGWDPLLDAAPGVQSSRAWYAATEAAALPPDARPLWLMAEQGGAPVGLLPMMREGDGRLCSLTTPYTVEFRPLLAAGTDPAAMGRAFGRHLRRFALSRLEAMEPEWPGLPPFLAGLRRAGLVPLQFDHFGNWHETVEGGWEAYLAGRPSALRGTIRRRTRSMDADPAVSIQIIRSQHDVPAALTAYEAVYARSWKEPEPYPGFAAALLPRLAEAGWLRLAILRIGDTPIAAQYWTVRDGVAMVLKLAYVEQARGTSPGTVLSAHVIRTLLDQEGVHTLDYGRGDDPYKQGWTRARRQRVGVLLASPTHAAGLRAIATHAAGLIRARLRRGPRDVASGT